MQTININYINPKKGAKLLDLGCGEGRHCFGAYMHSDLDVFGFDMSKDDVQKALNNFEEFNENSPSKSCSFGVTDARKLPFSDNYSTHNVYCWLFCNSNARYTWIRIWVL